MTLTTTLQAIYENGKLTLPQPLPLPDKTPVQVTIGVNDDADVERAAWLKLSEQSLLRAWDNPEDDVFNELLAK